MNACLSAAQANRRIGITRKTEERWNMAEFSRQLSARLRERDPDFRAASDKSLDRAARRAR